MKKFYIFILVLLFAGLNTFSQTLEKLSKERATKIALQRGYDETETAMFVERATGNGVNLSPRKIPNLFPPIPLTGANNLDFEQQNFTGWTGSYSISSSFNCGAGTPNPAANIGTNFTAINVKSDETGICTGGTIDSAITNGVLPCNSPYGGFSSCRLGDVTDGCGVSYLAQTFTVNMPDTQITMYYALVLYDGHVAADAPKFSYKIKTASGITIDSVYYTAANAGSVGSGFLPSGTYNGLFYRPWDSRTTSLAGYVGQNLTIDFYTSDCDGGAHRGYAYIDIKYNGQSNPCGWLPPSNLCFVTTDSSNHNEIYFNHITSTVPQQGTIVYRKNSMGNWDSLGTVPAFQPDKFVDYTSFPGLSSYTYCVAPVDSCYNNYAKSSSHGTINLQSNVSGTGQINLSWNAYSGLAVNKYHIYRGNSLSNMTFLAQVSSSTFTYTDVNPPIGNDYYKIAIVAPTNCTSSAPHDTIIESNYIYQPITCNNSVLPTAVCFVTTSDSLHNEVYFNHGGGGLRYTIVYRQNALSNWDSIGFVPAAMPDKYVDLGVNPNQQAYTYCVEEVDSCGFKHGKTPAHTTILMQSSLGTGTQINLSWNAYVGMPIASYYIFRGPTPFTMTLLAQVSSSTLAYTDLNPPAGPNFYKIAVLAPTNCTSSATHDTLVGSNYKWNGITGIVSPNKQELFNVYPNPSNGLLNVECKVKNAEIKICDALGNVVKQTNATTEKTSIDVNDLQNGVYFVSVKTAKGFVTKKIVVQH